jgi:hypothetical protein
MINARETSSMNAPRCEALDLSWPIRDKFLICCLMALSISPKVLGAAAGLVVMSLQANCAHNALAMQFLT